MILARLAAGVLFVALAVSPSRGAAPKLPDKLKHTGLAPSKLVPNLCLVRYRISTTSPKCQEFFDQALGYYYSYVWMEAARSFETALAYDPDCPLAWWGLSRSLERWGRGAVATTALLEAHKRLARASHREQYLIKATMQEKGQLPGVGDGEARRRAATATIDEMLALYDDDEEGWYYRAQLAGGSGLFGGKASSVPFYKALLKVNPLHPGANHELLHFYENFRRPALGWVHAENYIKSTPGIPHPFHMQAHLATRLGRWGKTSDRSAHAIELQRAYHKEMNVKPSQDSQYSHHLEILLISLVHDGRFAEARAIESEARAAGYKQWAPWFSLRLAARDFPAALKLVEEYARQRKNDRMTPSYWRALIYLKQGKPERALPEIEVLQRLFRTQKQNRRLEYRLWETQGLYMCQTGAADAGLKLLARAVERSKNDYGHHAWGNGAYYMEAWGLAALKCSKDDVAEEGLLEALAHDPGSVRAALGLQVLCERQGRAEEAQRYAAIARRDWAKADAGKLDAELINARSQHATGKPQSRDGAH